MDIRERLKGVLNKYGYTVAYIRTDQRFRCDCYSEREGEATRLGCPNCFGTGFKATVEKVKTRRTPLTMPESLVAVRHTASPGNIVVGGYTYYMEHDIVPRSGDFILEVAWEKGVPVKLKEKLKISAVDKKDGLHGRVEFYQVYARTHWTEEGETSGIDKI